MKIRNVREICTSQGSRISNFLPDIDPKEQTLHHRQHPNIVPTSSLFVLPNASRAGRKPM
jgi:hypothetical protein